MSSLSRLSLQGKREIVCQCVYVCVCACARMCEYVRITRLSLDRRSYMCGCVCARVCLSACVCAKLCVLVRTHIPQPAHGTVQEAQCSYLLKFHLQPDVLMLPGSHQQSQHAHAPKQRAPLSTYWLRVSVPVLSEARTSMPDISSRTDSLCVCVHVKSLCAHVSVSACGESCCSEW